MLKGNELAFFTPHLARKLKQPYTARLSPPRVTAGSNLSKRDLEVASAQPVTYLHMASTSECLQQLLRLQRGAQGDSLGDTAATQPISSISAAAVNSNQGTQYHTPEDGHCCTAANCSGPVCAAAFHSSRVVTSSVPDVGGAQPTGTAFSEVLDDVLPREVPSLPPVGLIMPAGTAVSTALQAYYLAV